METLSAKLSRAEGLQTYSSYHLYASSRLGRSSNLRCAERTSVLATNSSFRKPEIPTTSSRYSSCATLLQSYSQQIAIRQRRKRNARDVFYRGLLQKLAALAKVILELHKKVITLALYVCENGSYLGFNRVQDIFTVCDFLRLIFR